MCRSSGRCRAVVALAAVVVLANATTVTHSTAFVHPPRPACRPTVLPTIRAVSPQRTGSRVLTELRRLEDNIFHSVQYVEGRSIKDALARASYAMRLWLWAIDDALQKALYSQRKDTDELIQFVQTVQPTPSVQPIQPVQTAPALMALSTTPPDSTTTLAPATLCSNSEPLSAKELAQPNPVSTTMLVCDEPPASPATGDTSAPVPQMVANISLSVDEPPPASKAITQGEWRFTRAHIEDAKRTPSPLRPVFAVFDTTTKAPVTSELPNVLSSYTSLWGAEKETERRHPLAVKYLEPLEREAIEEYRKAQEAARAGVSEMEARLLSVIARAHTPFPVDDDHSLAMVVLLEALEQQAQLHPHPLPQTEQMIDGVWELVFTRPAQRRTMLARLFHAARSVRSVRQTVDAAEGRVVQIEEGRLLRILPYTVTREGVVKDEGRCIIGLGRPKVRVGPLTLRRGLGMGHEEDQRVTYVSDSLRVCRLHDGHGMVAFKKQSKAPLETIYKASAPQRRVWDVLPRVWKRNVRKQGFQPAAAGTAM